MGNIIPLSRRRDFDDGEPPTKVNKKRRPLSNDEQQELERLGLKSFVQEYSHLRKIAGADDFSSSKAAYALLRAQLSATIRAISIMDKSFEESGGRNAYSYVAVHTLARELSHDLRAFGDQTELTDRIRRDVVQSVLQSLATNIVSEIISERKVMRGKLPAKVGRYVDERLRLYQERLNSAFVDADTRAAEALPRALSAR